MALPLAAALFPGVGVDVKVLKEETGGPYVYHMEMAKMARSASRGICIASAA